MVRRVHANGPAPRDEWEYREHLKLLRHYRLLEPYRNSRTAVLHQHIPCGHIWKIPPKDVPALVMCPHCAGNQRDTPVQYQQRLNVIRKGEFILTGRYDGRRKATLHFHTVCQKTIMERPRRLLEGKLCPKCKEIAQDTKHARRNPKKPNGYSLPGF